MATPKRTFIIITSIFVVLIASLSPQYYYYRTGKKFVSSRNKTLIGIIYSKDLLDFEGISYPINIIIIPFFAYFIIIIATAIPVIQLHMTSKWREKAAISGNTAKLTTSNMKIAKVVIMISVLFISSYIPVVVNCIAMNVVPGFTINGKLEHMVISVGGTGVLLESINASMNIFIYYYMSSKYRDVFREMLFRKKGRYV